jgi:hypothetical protein
MPKRCIGAQRVTIAGSASAANHPPARRSDVRRYADRISFLEGRMRFFVLAKELA